jgi:hypothetical protein
MQAAAAMGAIADFLAFRLEANPVASRLNQWFPAHEQPSP